MLLEALDAEQLGADGLVGVRKDIDRGTDLAEEAQDVGAPSMEARRARCPSRALAARGGGRRAPFSSWHRGRLRAPRPPVARALRPRRRARFSPYGPYTRLAFGHIGFTNIVCWADPEAGGRGGHDERQGRRLPRGLLAVGGDAPHRGRVSARARPLAAGCGGAGRTAARGAPELTTDAGRRSRQPTGASVRCGLFVRRPHPAPRDPRRHHARGGLEGIAVAHGEIRRSTGREPSSRGLANGDGAADRGGAQRDRGGPALHAGRSAFRPRASG